MIPDLIRLSQSYLGYGEPDISIGLIDGPVNSTHHDFEGARISTIDSGNSICNLDQSLACKHGSFVAGILVAQENSPAPGICRNCTLISRPIFCEAMDFSQCPLVTPDHLAQAIHELLDQRASVINMSLGLSPGIANFDYKSLLQAYDRAMHEGTFIVAAAGNYGQVGKNPIFDHDWVIPVAACDLNSQILPSSNIGRRISYKGLMAPGMGITSTNATGGHTQIIGTSVAAPFVSGSIALLVSKFRDTPALEIKRTLLPLRQRRSIIPQILNVNESFQRLKTRYKQVA